MKSIDYQNVHEVLKEGIISEDKFWKKSWDEGIDDLDPQIWETNFVDAVKPVFKKYPDSLALAFLGMEISYRELDQYANRFANMLVKNGLQKGDVVGINLPNIPQYVIAWLGTLRAGCTVSGVSPLLSAGEMEYQLKDSKARCLVTLDAIYAERFAGIANNLPDLKIAVAASVGGFLPLIKRFLGKLLGKIPKGKVTPLSGKTVLHYADVIKPGRFSESPPSVNLTPDDVAYVQYTGGTTGQPKGAVLSHRNALSVLVIVQKWLKWKPEDVVLSAFPLFHIAGLFLNENCVYQGCTQILIPNPRDIDSICNALEKYKPTFLVNVPSLYQLLTANTRFQQMDHSTLKICISSASPFPEESQKELEAIVGKDKLLEMYGMTETSPLIAMNPLEGKKMLGSIGLPVPNTDIKLIEPGTNRVVSVDEPGEICIKGPQVMKGYFNKPEETKNAIDQDGYLHTGDVAIMDENGYLRIVDRTKDMIIVSGFKVFSNKVEGALAEHPAIELIALVGTPNPDRPGSELVKAYVTVMSGLETSDNLKEEIIEFAKEKLAPYEVPKLIEFIDDMPLTSVGKIDKKVLRQKEK